VGEDKIIKSIAERGEEYFHQYDVSIDVDRKSLVISSGYMTIWRRYETHDDLLNGVIKLLKVAGVDSAKVDMGYIPYDNIDKIPGLKERFEKWYNATVSAYANFEKKLIEFVIDDEDLGVVDTLTLEFHDAESFLRALDEYSN
jgi:hypothetical protein